MKKTTRNSDAPRYIVVPSNGRFAVALEFRDTDKDSATFDMRVTDGIASEHGEFDTYSQAFAVARKLNA